MNARSEILERLNAKSRKSAIPEVWVSQRKFESLPEQFSSALKAVKGEVVVAGNLNNAWDVLGGLLKRLSAKKVVVTDEMPVNQVDYSERFGVEEWHLVGKTEGDHREFCASADVSIRQHYNQRRAWAQQNCFFTSSGSHCACPCFKITAGYLCLDN